MANNRMFLVSQSTGLRVRIAKYYPSTGWYMEKDTPERANEIFDSVQDDNFFSGDTDWIIEYEIADD